MTKEHIEDQSKAVDVEKSPEPKARKKELKRYMITFLGEGGDVEIGHNFKLNVYQRNVPVEIDENFLQVVKDAVVTSDVPNGQGGFVTKRKPVYQFEVEAI